MYHIIYPNSLGGASVRTKPRTRTPERYISIRLFTHRPLAARNDDDYCIIVIKLTIILFN